MAQTNPERPGIHPDPPDTLSEQELTLIPVSGSWFRIHSECYEPIYFSRSSDYRFNAPKEEYGILYLGIDEESSFIETCLRERFRAVTSHHLKQRCISRIRSNRPLQLVDLTGVGLNRIGADARLCTGSYNISQSWAIAFWHHPSQPDGIYYRSRYDPSRYCLGLFDRVATEIEVIETIPLLDNSYRSRLAQILDHYEIGFLETS